MNSSGARLYLERRLELHRYTERKLGKIDLVIVTEPVKRRGKWHNRLMREHREWADRVDAVYLESDEWELKKDGVHFTLLGRIEAGIGACEAALNYLPGS